MDDIRIGQVLLTAGKHYTCIAKGEGILVLQEKKIILKDSLKPVSSKEVDLNILRDISIEDLENFVKEHKKQGEFISIGVKYYILHQYMGYTISRLSQFYGKFSSRITQDLNYVKNNYNVIAKADTIVLALCRWKLNNK